MTCTPCVVAYDDMCAPAVWEDVWSAATRTARVLHPGTAEHRIYNVMAKSVTRYRGVAAGWPTHNEVLACRVLALLQRAGVVVLPAAAERETATATATRAVKAAFRDVEALTYTAGACFARHRDRWRGKGHVGTLLLIGPSTCVGGELRLHACAACERNADDSIIIAPAADAMRLVFFPLCCEHDVTEVCAGERHVLKASVFCAVAR